MYQQPKQIKRNQVPNKTTKTQRQHQIQDKHNKHKHLSKPSTKTQHK